MFNDVVDLRDFYASPLGQVARRLIRRRLRDMWPDVKARRLVGLGYATPFLRPYMAEAERVIAVMPASQGVMHWPTDAPGMVVLADEAELPLPDRSADRILMVHALECSEQLRAMLREAWRVLADGGRILTVVPNRRGIWARTDRTPFGHGHPYSHAQLSRLLRETMFTPMAMEQALFVPPSGRGWLVRAAPAWERVGERWFPAFAGVILVESTKQIYAAGQVGAVSRRLRLVPRPSTAARGATMAGRKSGGEDG